MSLKFGILNFMRPLFSLLMLLVACGSHPPETETDSESQAYSGPPRPILCEAPKVVCGIDCVDMSRDNMNCGDCGNVCDVAQGEFCLSYYCRDVRDYGFYLGPVGPVEYDVRRDLPRPPRILEEDR